MGARAIEAGYQGGPSAFIIPAEQHDPSAAKKLEELLLQGGVEIHRALEPFRADGDAYPAGVDIILAGAAVSRVRQDAARAPELSGDAGCRRLARATLRRHRLDAARADGRRRQDDRAPLRSTGDVAADRRDDRAGAGLDAIATPSYYVVDARGNGGAIAANRLLAAGLAPAWLTGDVDARGFKFGPGSLVVAATKAAPPVLQKIAAELGLRVDGLTGKLPAGTRPLARSRVGLYKSWIDNVDEGWTRWLLEQYEFPYKSIADADVRAGNLRAQFDVIILPSLPPDRIAGGLSQDVVPADYAGGLGDAGGRALKAFVESGGTLVSLDQAGGFAISTLGLAHSRRDARSAQRQVFRPRLDPSRRGRPRAAARVRDEPAHGGIFCVQLGLRDSLAG